MGFRNEDDDDDKRIQKRTKSKTKSKRGERNYYSLKILLLSFAVGDGGQHCRHITSPPCDPSTVNSCLANMYVFFFLNRKSVQQRRRRPKQTRNIRFKTHNLPQNTIIMKAI